MGYITEKKEHGCYPNLQLGTITLNKLSARQTS